MVTYYTNTATLGTAQLQQKQVELLPEHNVQVHLKSDKHLPVGIYLLAVNSGYNCDCRSAVPLQTPTGSEGSSPVQSCSVHTVSPNPPIQGCPIQDYLVENTEQKKKKEALYECEGCTLMRHSQKHSKGVLCDNASPPDINVSLSHLHNY